MRCTRGNHLENLVLRESDAFGTLAFGNVGYAHPDQASLARRQSAETYFAGNLLALGVFVHPLEGGVPAIQGRVDVAAAHAK